MLSSMEVFTSLRPYRRALTTSGLPCLILGVANLQYVLRLPAETPTVGTAKARFGSVHRSARNKSVRTGRVHESPRILEESPLEPAPPWPSQLQDIPVSPAK